MSFCPNNRPIRTVKNVAGMLDGPIRYSWLSQGARKITSKVPGLDAAAKLPGKVYEGAAGLVPNAIKDTNLPLVGRVGDAADSIAQTFSPVSLNPEATPLDHAAQLGMAWSGGKLLGAGAKALGKFGSKVVNGTGAAGAAADHLARVHGREVPSMAGAGGSGLGAGTKFEARPRIGSEAAKPSVPDPSQMSHAGSSGTPAPVPSQFKDMGKSSRKEPGYLSKKWNGLPEYAKYAIAGGVGTPAAAAALTALTSVGGAASRHLADKALRDSVPPDVTKKKADQKKKHDDREQRAYEINKQGNVKGR